MRPAQLTPENLSDRPQERLGRNTSMRPAQLTPENMMHLSPRFRGRIRTSMRPAQLTPENLEQQIVELLRFFPLQ